VKFKRTLIVLVLLLTVIGFRIGSVSFPEYQSNRERLSHGFFDYRGLIHLHTTYSDGEGTVEEVAQAGHAVGMDFLISTDHNTLQALLDQKEGWYNHLLFLVGEEVSMKGGYILALNITQAVEEGREREPQAVVNEVRNHGGMAFISHPLNYRFKWENWDVEGTIGMEIIDLDDQWRKTNPLYLLWGIMTFPLNPSYALLNILGKPQDVVDLWDGLTSKKPVVGIYSPDLHDQVRVTKGFYIKFPPREKTMALISNHLLLSQPFTGDLSQDKNNLYEALKKGHLYLALDLLGNPRGFIFRGFTQTGKQVIMGDRIVSINPVRLEASLGTDSLPQTYRIKLIHNGMVIDEIDNAPLHFETTQPGTYRVEVEVPWISPFFIPHRYTWIYSNPIYVQ